MTVLLVHMSRCPVCFCSPLVLAKSQLDNHVDAELNVVQWHTFWRVVCCEPHRCHSRSSSSGRRFSQWLIPAALLWCRPTHVTSSTASVSAFRVGIALSSSWSSLIRNRCCASLAACPQSQRCHRTVASSTCQGLSSGQVLR